MFFNFTNAALELAVAADVGNRQVQLEQGIVHCIVLLED